MILPGEEPTKASKPRPARPGYEADCDENINNDQELRM